MRVAGDFVKLRALQSRLASMQSPEAMQGLARVVGEAARTQLALGFRNSVDPYGGAWAALKQRRRRGVGRDKPLLDTGRLRNSFTYKATPDGLTIGTNVRYAKFHQYGTAGRSKASGRFQAVDASGKFMSRRKAGVKRPKGVVYLWHGVRRLEFKAGGGKIPARMMLPIKERGLGNWQEPMQRAAKRFVARKLRGK